MILTILMGFIPYARLHTQRPIWSYLDLSRAIWRYLELPGTTWSHLEPSEAIWSSGAVCNYLELPGAIWNYPELSRAIWSHLDKLLCHTILTILSYYTILMGFIPYAGLHTLIPIWNYLTLSGAIWNYLELSGAT